MTTYLEDEILMEILVRLPVRSLCKFKCVSKYWRTLISDSYVKMMHLNRAKNDPNSQKLLVYQWFLQDDTISIHCLNLLPSAAAAQPVGNIRRLDFPSTYKPRRLHLACCCDGLAIIAAYYNVDIDVWSQRYLLWNPSTGESAPLPDPQLTEYSGILMGLGYDSASGGYKILATYSNRDCPGEILAMKSGCSWRYIDKHPRGIIPLNQGTHCLPLLNGAFHWIGTLGDYFLPYSVVSFSISKEVYGDIPLPQQLSCSQRRCIPCGISALDGMLCVYSDSDLRGTFKLWVLKDYDVKGYWTSLLTIKDPYIGYLAVPKYRFADGELLYWGLGTGGHAFRTLNGPFGLWPQCDSILAGFAFTESLISPKSLI